MREIFRIVKENFILLLGTGLFIYGLFSFESSYYEGIFKSFVNKDKLWRWGLEEIRIIPIATYYYYDLTSKKLLTIGAILIVFGLIKLRERKNGV